MIPGRVVWGGGALWSVALVTSLIAAEGGQTTSRAEAAKLKNPVASNAASVATGQQLFQKYCRFCHGATGEGDSTMAPKDMKPSNLTDATWDRGSSEGEIFWRHPGRRRPEVRDEGAQGQGQRHRHLASRELRAQPWWCREVSRGGSGLALLVVLALVAAALRRAGRSRSPDSAERLAQPSRWGTPSGVLAGAPHRRRSHS